MRHCLLSGDTFTPGRLLLIFSALCFFTSFLPLKTIWKVYPLAMPLLIWSVTYKSRGQNLSQYRLEANTWNKNIILEWEDLEGWNKRITLLHDCRGQDKAFLLLLLQFWKSNPGPLSNNPSLLTIQVSPEFMYIIVYNRRIFEVKFK